MINKTFKYSDLADYPHSSAFKKKEINIINQEIVITSDGKSFKASLPNIFEKYKLPYVESDALVQKWKTNWMSFWQKQTNLCWK